MAAIYCTEIVNVNDIRLFQVIKSKHLRLLNLMALVFETSLSVNH